MSTTTEVISSANELLSAHSALISRVRTSQKNHRRQLRSLPSPPWDLIKLPLIPTPPASPSPSPPSSPLLAPKAKPQRPDLPPSKRARIARYDNYVPEEETIRNDYSQRYVDGGEWPQNWVLGAEPEHRFEEYPKQQRLLNLKKTSVTNHALPPSYIPFSALNMIHPCKFDVILIDPPFSSSFGWEELEQLPIPSLAADPSFAFMWVGSGAGEGLERGREILGKWGYRRCEDVVWVKTNTVVNQGPGTDPPTTSLLTRTKQHCLIGIRGTVRRSTDSWFVHCNIDTDVIIWEGDPSDPTRKPPEMYTLIENFCLGTRRLEIFGRARSSLRRGWVTVLADGEDEQVGNIDCDSMAVDGVGTTRWEKETWENGIRELANGGKCVVPMTAEIDVLRPKSPVRGGTSNTANSGSTGRTAPQAFSGGTRVAFNNNGNQNPMMNQPMMGMGMNMMGAMPMEGMVGWPGMNMGQVPMMPQPGMPMMNMNPMAVYQNPMGGPGFVNQNMNGGFPGFNGQGGMGMGWMNGEGNFMDNGMWEGEGMMGEGVPMGFMQGPWGPSM